MAFEDRTEVVGVDGLRASVQSPELALRLLAPGLPAPRRRLRLVRRRVGARRWTTMTGEVPAQKRAHRHEGCHYPRACRESGSGQVGMPLIEGVVVVMFEQSTPTPLWRDPLFSPADRFPLGPPHWHWDGCQDEPSGPTTRPFSLRGVVAGPRMDVEVHWPYRYCPERQVAFVHSDDGSAVPYLKHTKPGPTPVTSGTTDGQPGKPPPEEMASPDYQSD